jgi:hypothetical protein
MRREIHSWAIDDVALRYMKRRGRVALLTILRLPRASNGQLCGYVTRSLSRFGMSLFVARDDQLGLGDLGFQSLDF